MGESSTPSGDNSLEAERREITSYMKSHNLESSLNDVVNELVKERPADPYSDLSQTLRDRSKMSGKILDVKSREVMGSNGFPCYEVCITTLRGRFVTVVANVGPFDGDEDRCGGRGLLKAVETTQTLLGDKLLGLDPTKQSEIDSVLNSDMSHPRCAILGLSACACKAGAAEKEVDVYVHVGELANVSTPQIPLPWFTLVNGGEAAKNEIYPHSMHLALIKATTISEAIEQASDIYRTFPPEFVVGEEGDDKLSDPNQSNSGGFAPSTESVERCMKAVKAAAVKVGNENGIKIGLNMQVKEYSEKLEDTEDNDGEEDAFQYELSKYQPEGSVSVLKNSGEMVDQYYEWLTSYPLVYLEDSFDRRDGGGLMSLKEKIEAEHERYKTEGGDADEESINYFPGNVGGKHDVLVQLSANETITSPDDITRADEKQIVNNVCLSLIKAGSVSKLIELNAKAERLGMKVVYAGDEGEGIGNGNGDVFNSHLAVGLKASQFKGGGLLNGGFAEQYNEFIRIQEKDDAIKYVGGNYMGNKDE